MKTTPIILLSLAVAGLAAPVYSQNAQPATPAVQSVSDSFESICDEIVNCQERCAAAVVTVKDAGSAAAAAKTLREEMETCSKLRKSATTLCPELLRGDVDPKIAALEAGMEEAVAALGEDLGAKMKELLALDPPCYGCSELQEAFQLYIHVTFQGMTPTQAIILDKVMQLGDENNLIRYEARKAVASVHDRASADAASAKLAELIERQDKNFQALDALLSQLPEDEVDAFCEIALAAGQEGSETKPSLPKDFATSVQAAMEKMKELGAMSPAFYGSPDLQERASNFIMMPR